MGCGGDIKESENKPKVENKESNVNNNQNNNLPNVKNDNIVQNNNNQNANKIPAQDSKVNEPKLNKSKSEQKPNINQVTQIGQNVPTKKEKEKDINQNINKIDKSENKNTSSNSDIDTTDFNEDKYPVFQSNFYEKYIQDIRKTSIEKTSEGAITLNKIYITIDHNQKKTKIIKISIEEKNNEIKKHLTQKILNEVCFLEKFKEDLTGDGLEIKPNEIFSKTKTTDIYIMGYNFDGNISKFTFYYDKNNASIKINNFKGNNMSYSTSNSSSTNLSPEKVVERYNESVSKIISGIPSNINSNSVKNIKKEEFNLIEASDDQGVEFTQFQEEGLKMHNVYRTAHHVPELKLNKELCDIAQKYADYLAKNQLFEHSHARFKGGAMGENLYMCSGFTPNGGEGVTSWYNEIKDYDFKTGQSTGGVIGHFTQVVWKGSEYVGMGIGQNGNSYYVVANYYPAGNWQGKYIENVLPK